MSNAIGARQVNWYHMVLALSELDELIERANDVQFNHRDHYNHLLSELSTATLNMLTTEKWDKVIPLYDSVTDKLKALVAKYPLPANDTDPCEFKDLCSMLHALNHVRYSVNTLRIDLLFVSRK